MRRGKKIRVNAIRSNRYNECGRESPFCLSVSTNRTRLCSHVMPTPWPFAQHPRWKWSERKSTNKKIYEKPKKKKTFPANDYKTRFVNKPLHRDLISPILFVVICIIIQLFLLLFIHSVHIRCAVDGGNKRLHLSGRTWDVNTCYFCVFFVLRHATTNVKHARRVYVSTPQHIRHPFATLLHAYETHGWWGVAASALRVRV